MITGRTTFFAFGAALLIGCGGSVPTAPLHAPDAKPVAPSAPKIETAVTPPLTHEQAEAALIKTIASQVTRFAVGARPNEPRRPHVSPVAVKLSSLALAHVPEPLPNPAIPMTGPLPGDPTDEIAPERMGQRQYGYQDVNMVLKSKAPLSGIHIGPWPDGTTTASTSGYARCGKDVGFAISPVRWETLVATGNGTLDYTIVDGWFDHATCKASIVRSTKVSAVAIVPGLLYGFRQCQGDCDQTSLTLLMASTPSAVASGAGAEGQTEQVTGFTRVTVPLRRGAGLSFMAELGQYQLSPWRTAMGTESPTYLASQLLVGFEVSQGVEDKEPIAVGYVADATPGATDAALSSLDSFDNVGIKRRR